MVEPRSILPSSNEIALIPYVELESGWTLPDQFIYALAGQMVREGVFYKVFYDGNVVDPEGFMSVMKKPANVPVFFFDGHEPLGFAYLNGLVGGMGFAHFCGLRASLGRTNKIGNMVLRYWMANFKFLRLILGLTPQNNKLALRFIRSIGFTSLGVIPGVLYDAYAAERVGGVVSYYTRQE